VNDVGDNLNTERHDQFLRHFTANEAAIRAFVRSLLPTREDAREVMQDVAVVLWRKFREFPTDEDFRRWAFRVARYEVLAYTRDKARDRLVLSEKVLDLLAAQATESASVLEAQREALENCLEKLPAVQRQMVNRAYAPGARIDWLAKESDRTAMSLYRALHRIRLTLVECVHRVLLSEELI
jgi:RNA polymerase sigma-70 factor, ECF subfamily